MSERARKLPRVELLNVPLFRQGSFENLCTYYTVAMMLSTLFPGDTRRFGKTTSGQRHFFSKKEMVDAGQSGPEADWIPRRTRIQRGAVGMCVV